MPQIWKKNLLLPRNMSMKTEIKEFYQQFLESADYKESDTKIKVKELSNAPTSTNV